MKLFEFSFKPYIKLSSASQDTHLPQEIVCYNQGKIADYLYMQQNYSKRLTKQYSKLPQKLNEDSVDILRKTMDDYKETSVKFLATCVIHNLSFAQKYFLNRHKESPRGCLKLFNKFFKSDRYI